MEDASFQKKSVAQIYKIRDAKAADIKERVLLGQANKLIDHNEHHDALGWSLVDRRRQLMILIMLAKQWRDGRAVYSLMLSVTCDFVFFCLFIVSPYLSRWFIKWVIENICIHPQGIKRKEEKDKKDKEAAAKAKAKAVKVERRDDYPETQDAEEEAWEDEEEDWEEPDAEDYDNDE